MDHYVPTQMEFRGDFDSDQQSGTTTEAGKVRTLELEMEKGVFNQRPKYGLQEVYEDICRMMCVH